MTAKPRVLVLRTAGTNCDAETAFAFQYVGAKVCLAHVNQLLNGRERLADYHILALPGGFTYGDDIASGRILANELRRRLGEDLRAFIDAGKLILGICNGFQVMVKMGLLPDGMDAGQRASLTHNDSGRFEDRWVHLRVEAESVWTKGLPSRVYYPVAHAEGKFVVPSRTALKALRDQGRVAFTYCSADGGPPGYPDNPNGSMGHIAGITNATGRLLGLMPHPERCFLSEQHPFWARLSDKGTFREGALIFDNGVRYARRHLL